MRIGEGCIVEGGVALPAFRPAVQVFQFHAQHGGLQLIDAKVAADHRVKILGLAAVHP